VNDIFEKKKLFNKERGKGNALNEKWFYIKSLFSERAKLNFFFVGNKI